MKFMASLKALDYNLVSGYHSPDVATKLSNILMKLTESVGKKTRQLNPRPLKLPVGGKVGACT